MSILFKILEDVFSYGKGRKKYASKGDEVLLISDYDNVLIVEKSNKERFSVLKINVKKIDKP